MAPNQPLPPVSIVTVVSDGLFFIRLLVERVRAMTLNREYEIIVVDRFSRDGTRAWLRAQPDVRMITRPHLPWKRGHQHGEAAEAGIRKARFERVVLLDSDAHPISPDWLAGSADRLDDHHRLAGAIFRSPHPGNPHGWYVHPHFMAFFKSDLGGLIILRKLRGWDTDTGEEATIGVLAAGLGIVGHELGLYEPLAVGNPNVPTVAGGVVHIWYVSRLIRDEADVISESKGTVSRRLYLDPVMARLRQTYALNY